MKKTGLILLCVALFLLMAGGAAAWLYLSPRGVLHPGLPQNVMQSYLDSRSREDWRSEYVRLQAPPVTEFEDAAAVAGHLFDAAAGEEPIVFREEAMADPLEEAAYILSAGDADLFRARLGCEDGVWSVSGLEGVDMLSAETRTVTVTAPADAAVTVNGRDVGEAWVVDPMVIYEDMTEAELRFASYPHRVRYEIPGIFENVTVEVVWPEGEVLCLAADGTNYDYTVADAGAYTLYVTAPQEARLLLGGAEFTPADAAATVAYQTLLDIPEGLQGYLPSYCIYSLGGLYSPAVAMEAELHGVPLTAETDENGNTVFPVPAAQALYDETHERVETFLRQLCEYGAGHTIRSNPGAYAVPDSAVAAYIRNAISSLYWTANVTLTIRDIQTFDYLPLGEDAFVCRAFVDAHTSTYFQKKDLALGYEMFWVRLDGVWMLQDLAFTRT